MTKVLAMLSARVMMEHSISKLEAKQTAVAKVASRDHTRNQYCQVKKHAVLDWKLEQCHARQ